MPFFKQKFSSNKHPTMSASTSSLTLTSPLVDKKTVHLTRAHVGADTESKHNHLIGDNVAYTATAPPPSLYPTLDTVEMARSPTLLDNNDAIYTHAYNASAADDHAFFE